MASRLAEYVRPNRVRLPVDWSLASGCSPPRLTATQFPSATGRRAYAWRGLTPLRKCALAGALARGATPGNGRHPRNRAATPGTGRAASPGWAATPSTDGKPAGAIPAPGGNPGTGRRIRIDPAAGVSGEPEEAIRGWPATTRDCIPGYRRPPLRGSEEVSLSWLELRPCQPPPR